jgi:anaerobic selenocysteine-containing dehydrogenase
VPAVFVEIHHDDAERLGIGEGTPVTLTTAAGAVVVPASVTDGIAPGTAFVPYNQAGLPANTLLSGTFTTTATLAPAAGTDPIAAGSPERTDAATAVSPPAEAASAAAGADA